MAKQAGKGVEEFRPYVTKVIPVGANIVCADNSGAKILEVINVPRHKTRASRLPSASVGDFCNVVVKKGPAELRKQVYGAVIIRQKYAVRRLNGVRVCFAFAPVTFPSNSFPLIDKPPWNGQCLSEHSLVGSLTFNPIF